MKKYVFSLLACLMLITITTMSVSALVTATYERSVSIGKGATVSDNLREYGEGKHRVAFKLASTGIGNSGFQTSALKISLKDANGNTLGTATQRDITKNDINKDILFSYPEHLGAAKRRFVFTTNVDGMSYPSLSSNSVIMMSYK